MIVLALLLAGIGIADLVRALLPALPPRLAAARFAAAIPGAIGGAASAIAVLTGTLAAGVAWWWAIIIIALVAAWLAATIETGPKEKGADETGAEETGTDDTGAGRRRPGAARGNLGLWAIAGLAVATAVTFACAPALPAAGGALLRWYEWLPYRAAAETPIDTFALTLGGLLLLLETANVIVRIVLRRTAPASSVGLGSAVTPLTLKGGRVIGPLERLFILSLALGGQFTAIGAVIAAKGIIRFPEISKDEPGGSKAEYFLVGSFASWALVLAVAVLITLSV